MFQTDGPAKGKDLSPNVFVFTWGVTKVRVSDADRNCSKFNGWDVYGHEEELTASNETFPGDNYRCVSRFSKTSMARYMTL